MSSRPPGSQTAVASVRSYRDGDYAQLQKLITVREIMTPRVDFVACLVGETVSEATTDVPSNYDVLPVLAGHNKTDIRAEVIGMLDLRQVGSRTLNARVSDIIDARPLEIAIREDTPVISFISGLTGETVSLVGDDSGITGLVTLYDLERLPVRIALFAMLTDLEYLIGALIASVAPDNSEWSDLISRGEVGLQKSLSQSLKRARRTDGIGSDVLALSYAVKLAILNGLSTRGRLPGLSLQPTSALSDMRNDIAHGNPFPDVARIPGYTREVLTMLEQFRKCLMGHA